MNSRLKDILTVSGISFVVMLPAITVFAAVWQQHLSFVHTRHGAFVSTQSSLLPANLIQIVLGVGWVGVPLGLWVGSMGQTLYFAYRRFILKRQIAQLERLWQHTLYRENDRCPNRNKHNTIN